MREDIGFVMASLLAPLLASQYVYLFMAAASTSTESSACLPKLFAGAGRGWDSGQCLTDEQIWCRYKGNRHVDCKQADCRAEEIRLTLWYRQDRDVLPERGAFAYEDCEGGVEDIYDHILAMNGRNRCSRRRVVSTVSYITSSMSSRGSPR